MKAVVVENPGPDSTLTIGEVETPTPTADQLLVKHKATAINRADLLQRKGGYAPPENASPILGLEMSGVVEEIGSDVTHWKPGDEVCGLLPGGGYAEYSVIHKDLAMPKPSNLMFPVAAALPETFLTAYQALIWLGELQPGQSVLIHAGAGGVGSSAIQLAKLKGATVYTTTSKAPKIDQCIDIGADHAINYTKINFADRIEELTDGRGVDLVIDFIGADYWEKNLSALTMDGRLVVLGLLGGHTLEGVSMAPVLRKRLTIVGSTLRNRSERYKIELTQHFMDFAWDAITAGSIKPVMDLVFDWKYVEAAHQRMAENKNIGKIALQISG